MGFDGEHDLRLLLDGPELEKLLNDVVPEHVDNQLVRVVNDLVED